MITNFNTALPGTKSGGGSLGIVLGLIGLAAVGYYVFVYAPEQAEKEKKQNGL